MGSRDVPCSFIALLPVVFHCKRVCTFVSHVDWCRLGGHHEMAAGQGSRSAFFGSYPVCREVKGDQTRCWASNAPLHFNFTGCGIGRLTLRRSQDRSQVCNNAARLFCAPLYCWLIGFYGAKPHRASPTGEGAIHDPVRRRFFHPHWLRPSCSDTGRT
jgi:hypothetical protein